MAGLHAAEPAEKFLNALQDRGYSDLALTYLQRLESSSTIPISLKETLGFRKGEVLVKEALSQRLLARKQKLLDEAQDEFQRFLSASPKHPLTLSAASQLGTIQMERARLLLQEAQDATTPKDRREALSKQSRRLFDAAGKVFDENSGNIRKRLEAMPAKLTERDDAELLALRTRLRNEYVQARVVMAMVPYEKALTYSSGGTRKKLLKQAEKEFESIAKKYRRRLAGLSAVRFQGLARQQQGDTKGALAVYEDLLQTLQGADEALRPLTTRTLVGAMECWIDDEINQFEAARQRAEAWIKTQRPTERGSTDWLNLKMLLVQTYLRMLESDDVGREKDAITSAARRLTIEVTKFNSSHRDEAQQLLTKLGGNSSVEAGDAESSVEVNTFEDGIRIANDLLSKRPARVAQAGGEGEEAIAEFDRQVVAVLTRTLDLADDESSIDQVNLARYYLATLHFYRGDFLKSAVIADFLSSRFPSSNEGRRAAAIALAALTRLYGQFRDDGQGDLAETLNDRLREMAERIARQWAGEAEGDDGLATLVSIELREGKTQEAARWLSRMTENSTKRAQAEIAVGQAIWQTASQAVASGSSPQTIQPQFDRAVEILEPALERTQGEPPTLTGTMARLLVAQFKINRGQAIRAVEILDEPQVGPRVLVDGNHELLRQRPALRNQAYLLSLMAYIAALPESNDADQLVDRALATLELMTRGQSEQQMSTTYVMLARNLQQQIRTAPRNKRTTLVSAFEQFLERASSSSKELSVQNWVADAYANLASASESDEADKFYGLAATKYEQILQSTREGEFAMTPQVRLATQNRLAGIYRDRGDYTSAIDLYTSILKTQNNQIYVQLEAARTLKAWGENGRNDAYLEAISGTRRDSTSGRNIIWGYGRIAKLAAGKKQLSNLFFEARLELARCRYQHGISQAAADRQETLEQAERDVLMTSRLYPDLGGKETKDQFAKLLQSVQQAMGKAFTGLES